MSHPTDFAPIPPPPKDDAPKAVMMEIDVRIMHPGQLWKIGPDQFCREVAAAVARLTGQHCGGALTQRVTVEVVPVRKGIEPQLVSGTIRELTAHF